MQVQTRAAVTWFLCGVMKNTQIGHCWTTRITDAND